eukprot:1157487-Pelagomonas_calceolata.AAC.6
MLGMWQCLQAHSCCLFQPLGHQAFVLSRHCCHHSDVAALASCEPALHTLWSVHLASVCAAGGKKGQHGREAYFPGWQTDDVGCEAGAYFPCGQQA